MAGYTGGVYREMLREHGCPYCVTEMVSAKGLVLGGGNSDEILGHTSQDRPLAVQLFGYDPGDMARATRKVQEEGWGFDCVDINMGCPARKVTSQGSGGALLKDLPRAVAIVAAVRAASKLPITAKARIGWDSGACVEDMAVALAEAGLDMLVVHGRTVEQGYSGKADWGAIERAARAVSIPVVGNGDVFGAAAAVGRLESGAVAGVMVGRAMLGNPVLFEDVGKLLSGERPESYTPGRKMALAAEHFRRSVERYGEVRGVLDMRKQLPFYFRGIDGAARLRGKLMGEKSPDAILRLLDEGWRN